MKVALRACYSAGSTVDLMAYSTAFSSDEMLADSRVEMKEVLVAG